MVRSAKIEWEWWDSAVHNIATRENFDFVKNDPENTDLQGKNRVFLGISRHSLMSIGTGRGWSINLALFNQFWNIIIMIMFTGRQVVSAPSSSPASAWPTKSKVWLGRIRSNLAECANSFLQLGHNACAYSQAVKEYFKDFVEFHLLRKPL